MAKNRSLIKIEGTLDDLTFYKGKDGYLVRTKGGVSKNRIKNDPAFARTRENGTEFGHIAKSGKLVRRSIIDLLSDVKDSSVTARLTKVMGDVKNADLTSARGDRQVAVGLTTAPGKALLKGFDFNSNALLTSVLLADFNLNTATGEVVIPNFIPAQRIVKPQGATHLSLSAGYLKLDLPTESKDLQLSNVVSLPINGTASTVTLTPVSVPLGAGNAMYFLKIAFFQEVNGVQYPLNNGTYNPLKLIEVL